MQQQGVLHFKNLYCDTLGSFLNCHFSRVNKDKVSLSEEEDRLLCEYSAIKNLMAGVEEVNLTCLHPSHALDALKRYNLKGKAVVDGMKLAEIDLSQKCIIIHIKNLLELTEKQLQDISMATGKNKVPLFITFGRSLNELGSLDKIYSMPPVKFLEDMGFLDRDCTLLGGNYLEKDDLEVLSMYDTKICLTPRSDMLCGRGFVNLVMLSHAGVEIEYGSGDYPYVDMLSEVSWGCGQTANLLCDGNAVSRLDALKGITSKPTKVLEDMMLSGKRQEISISQEIKQRYQWLEETLINRIKEKI